MLSYITSNRSIIQSSLYIQFASLLTSLLFLLFSLGLLVSLVVFHQAELLTRLSELDIVLSQNVTKHFSKPSAADDGFSLILGGCAHGVKLSIDGW